MDSISNLPLLEIAGEDDSLLFDVPAASTIYFSSSPLLSSLRSNPPQTEGEEGVAADSENLSSSLDYNCANKENTNWNKPEAQKLSVEPQQMKRKKKGGGYNLRKSLAWDRAFFTDQGVLNQMELSMISGATTPNSQLNLEVIQEEEPVGTSLALQEIEENLFKHSSDGVPIEDRKPAALAKASLAPASLAKRKVQTVNDVVGNRSKRSACPRPPVASSSLKKPDMVKTPSKELKVSRIPGPKSNVSVNATTTRSGRLTTGSSKRNQHVHPATNVPKNSGVKGLSKNPRTVPSKPTVDPADKCSVTKTLTKQAGKHLDNSASETHPPSRIHQSRTEKNKVSGAGLPQRASDIGEKKQETQLKTTKLSGLRMPSPSLGFFSQAKAPSELQKNCKPCKPTESSIPKLRNLETISVNEARLPHAHRIRSEMFKGEAKSCTEKLSLLDVTSEPNMQVDNKQLCGVEVKYDSMGSEKVSKQEKVENNLEHVNTKCREQGELHRSENVSCMEDLVFPRHEKELLSMSNTKVQFADNPAVLLNGDQSVFQEAQSMHYHGMQSTSIENGSISNTVFDAVGQDEDEQINLLACDVLTFNESLVPQAKHDTTFKDSRVSGEFKEDNSAKTALLTSSLIDFSETVLGGSIQRIPCKNTELVNDGAADFVISGGDAQVDLLNENLSVDCDEATQSSLEAVNEQLQGEQLKTTSLSIVGEISSKNENESYGNSCQLVHTTMLSSEGSPHKSIPEINGASENEPKVSETEDCQFPVDAQSSFIQRRSVDKGYEQVIDSKAIHDSTQVFESNSLSENSITVSATACHTNVSSVSQESRPFHENNVENICVISQLFSTVKADFDSRENDMSTDNSCTISERQLRDDSSSRDASMHYDVQCEVPGNFLHCTTYSIANEMHCEDESLRLNHGHLPHQSEHSEISTDFTSNTKDSIANGAETPSGHLQQALLAQSVQEYDHTNREIEQSQVEDAQVQSFNDNPVVYNTNSKHCLLVTNDQFSLADNNNNINEDSHLFDFQRPDAVVVDSQNVNNDILHLDSDRLLTNVASSEEIKKTNLFEDAIEGWNITSEHKASNHIQAMPENRDGNLDVDERAELLQIDDAEKGSSDILPLIEVQLDDNVISSECDSSMEVSIDYFTDVVAWKSEKRCSLSSNLPASDNLTLHERIPQVSEVSSLNSKTFSNEAETSILKKDELHNTDMQHQIKGDVSFAEDSSKIIHSKQEVSPVKPPPNAAPFSDEWLAAIEAAGEEILMMKGGAVQNSPPDKPQHEPGPWSPVKRKNQAIGPFDCTKHNIQHSSS